MSPENGLLATLPSFFQVCLEMSEAQNFIISLTLAILRIQMKKEFQKQKEMSPFQMLTEDSFDVPTVD